MGAQISKQNIQKLRQVRIVYGPFGSIETAQEYLMAKGTDFVIGGIVTVWSDPPSSSTLIQLLVIVNPDGAMDVIDISTIPANKFFGGLDQAGVENETNILLSKLTKIGMNPEDYSLSFCEPGETFTVPASTIHKVIAVSRKTPTFFDTGLAIKKNGSWQVVYYSKTNIGGTPYIRHSGDIDQNRVE